MKVNIYKGGLSLVKKSGVGQAIKHQESALNAAGVKISKGMAGADVVHINTVLPDSPVVALFNRIAGRRVIYYAHSTMEDFRNSFIGSNIAAPFFKRWIQMCYGLGNVIITPTPYSRGLIKGYGIKKHIYSLSNGVDTIRFRPDEECGRRFRGKYNLKDDEKAVISVGLTIDRKGILDYIELAKKHPNVRFFWFGDAPKGMVPSNILRAMKKAPSNLLFAGYVSQDEIKDAYCGADAFAFLSKEETEGIVILEALSCGCPVLVRDIPVYKGWLSNGKNCLKARGSEGFSKQLERILYTDISAIKEAGMRTADQRSLLSVGQNLEYIYRKEKLFKNY